MIACLHVMLHAQIDSSAVRTSSRSRCIAYQDEHVWRPFSRHHARPRPSITIMHKLHSANSTSLALRTARVVGHPACTEPSDELPSVWQIPEVRAQPHRRSHQPAICQRPDLSPHDVPAVLAIRTRTPTHHSRPASSRLPVRQTLFVSNTSHPASGTALRHSATRADDCYRVCEPGHHAARPHWPIWSAGSKSERSLLCSAMPPSKQVRRFGCSCRLATRPNHRSLHLAHPWDGRRLSF